MNTFLDRARAAVVSFLDDYLAAKKRDLRLVNPWGSDAVAKLTRFIKNGKMLRAGLVAVGGALAGGRRGRATSQAGAAVELIQAALLIHDDLMDRDAFRRGIPSVHRQYAVQAVSLGASHPEHFGEGMSLCLGDIAFFLGFDLLASLPGPPGVRADVVRLWSDELGHVGLAQMQDLYYGEVSPPVREADIFRLYMFKTARYSFSLPLSTGAFLSGSSVTFRRTLEDLGQTIGILFQLRDDELGLYGSEAELGKPVGSDIRESKLTLLRRTLFERAGRRDRAKLGRAFGNPDLTRRMVREVQEIVEALGVRAELRLKMGRLHARAARAIAGLEAPGPAKHVLREILDYCLTRER